MWDSRFNRDYSTSDFQPMSLKIFMKELLKPFTSVLNRERGSLYREIYLEYLTRTMKVALIYWCAWQSSNGCILGFYQCPIICHVILSFTRRRTNEKSIGTRTSICHVILSTTNSVWRLYLVNFECPKIGLSTISYQLLRTKQIKIVSDIEMNKFLRNFLNNHSFKNLKFGWSKIVLMTQISNF